VVNANLSVWPFGISGDIEKQDDNDFPEQTRRYTMKKQVMITIRFIVFLLGPFILSGCTATMAALDIAQGVFTANNIHNEITRADFHSTVSATFDQVWEVSIKSMTKLDIGVGEKSQNMDKDTGIINGSTPKHKIKIALAKVTGKTTGIGIWASTGRISRDADFAALLGTEIQTALARRKTH
jgi:hypothetical protein